MINITSRSIFTAAVVSLLLVMTVGAAQAESSPASDESVSVSDAQIAAMAAACSSAAESASCVAAVQTLINDLVAANTNILLSKVIGSVAARIASESNAGLAGQSSFDIGVLGNALSALASMASSNGLTSLAKTVAAVSTNVKSGVQVDLHAISSGAGITLDDKSASPA